MTESGGTERRGRPIVAVLAVVWVGLGFWAVEDGDMWRAAATILFGALLGATYLWPTSAFTRFVDAPVLRRKRPADR